MRGMYLVLLEIYIHMSNVILNRLEFKCHLLKPEIRRSLFGGGLYLDVVFYLDAVFIWMWSLFGCSLYLNVVIFWMGSLFGCGLYLDAVFIWMWSLFGCGLYLDGVIFWMGCLLN